MSAVPTEPFIKLNDFLAWALKRGCRIQTGFIAGGRHPTRVTVVTAPNGKDRVVIHDVKSDERLPQPVLRAYSRRLDLDDEFNPPPAPGGFSSDD